MRLQLINPENVPQDFDLSIHVALIGDSKIFFADKEDLDLLLSEEWMRGTDYLVLKRRDIKDRYFHRLIMGSPSGLMIDHVNRKKTDNRRCNLRSVHPSLNNHNVTRSGTKSGYLGVKIKAKRNGYEAHLTFQRKYVYIGYFSDPKEAAIAYDKKAIEIYGKDAQTNFPISNYEIPEKPTIATCEPMEFVRKKNMFKCMDCSEMIRRQNYLCELCQRKLARRDAAERHGKEYVPHIRKHIKLEKFCTHVECRGKEQKVFCHNLCSYHYRKLRESEGYKKPKKKYSCCAILPDGSTCLGAVIKIKERLCSTHYKEKHGLFKPLGRRPAPKL